MTASWVTFSSSILASVLARSSRLPRGFRFRFPSHVREGLGFREAEAWGERPQRGTSGLPALLASGLLLLVKATRQTHSTLATSPPPYPPPPKEHHLRACPAVLSRHAKVKESDLRPLLPASSSRRVTCSKARPRQHASMAVLKESLSGGGGAGVVIVVGGGGLRGRAGKPKRRRGRRDRGQQQNKPKRRGRSAGRGGRGNGAARTYLA